MEEDMETSGASLVPIALALLAIVLGGAGLYFGLNANQRIVPLAESVDEETSSTARIDKQISTLDTRLSELAAQYSELNKTLNRVRLYSSQSEQMIKQASDGIKSNRDEIVTLAEKMKELADAGAGGAARTVSVSNASSGNTTANAAGRGSDSTYVIKSGDTFAKIAKLKEVGLDALLAANPGINPRGLRIGQEIKIPTGE